MKDKIYLATAIMLAGLDQETHIISAHKTEDEAKKACDKYMREAWREKRKEMEVSRDAGWPIDISHKQFKQWNYGRVRELELF
jgi:hypothetical protein